MQLSKTRVSGLNLRRGRNWLADGDDAITYWVASGDPVAVEHAGQRRTLLPGQGMLIAHNRQSNTSFQNNEFMILRIPRAAYPDADAVAAACGQPHGQERPLLKLLRPYLRSIWRHANNEGAPLVPEMEQNLVLIVQALAATSVEGMRRTARPALVAARIAAMREIIARCASDPNLDMANVAAAVGLSERSGHLSFATIGLQFGDCVAQHRLDQVRERLRSDKRGSILSIALEAGFGDVAHFNRLFRRRYDMSPTEMRHEHRDADGTTSTP